MDRFEAIETRADDHVAGWVKTIDGAKLWVNIQGRGRPLILVHGWTMSSKFWRRQAPLSRSFQVVSIDLRGHGRSDSPLRGHSIPRYARDIREVITALDLKQAVLMGWSMGGAVALEYWQQYNADRIAAISLVETAPAPMSSAPWNTHRYKGCGQKSVKTDLNTMETDRNTYALRFINAMFLSGEAPSHALKWMKSEHLRTSNHAASAIYQDYAQRDYTGILPSTTVPALVLYGRSRHMCYGSSTGRFVAGSIPSSHFVILEKSGHMPFYEEADTFNSEVEHFINQLN